MTHIVVDGAFQTKLEGLAQPVELCDSSGRVLGRFVPTPSPVHYEGLESPISKEELERREQNKGKTYSTAEVLAHLEKL